MSVKRRRRVLVAGLLILAATVAVPLAASQREPRPTRVSLLAGNPAQPTEWRRHFWISPNEVLLFENGAEMLRPLPGRPVRLDTRTGHLLPLAPALQKVRAPLAVSPNGRWLLYGGRGMVSAIALDNSAEPERHWPNARPLDLGGWDVTWAPGRQGWLVHDSRARYFGPPPRPALVLYRFGAAKPIALAPLPNAGTWVIGAAGSDTVLAADWIATVTRANAGQLRLAPEGMSWERDVARLHVIAYTLLPPSSTFPARAATERHFAVPTPGRALHGTVQLALSPGGDRLAWLVIRPPRPLPRWIGWLPATITDYFVRNLAGGETSLWTSRLDAKNGRGGVPQRVLRLSPSIPAQELTWTPDGKHLSYVYDGALWTVPAQ